MGTYEKVCSIIAEQLGIKTEAVSKESDVINDLGADSIDIVQLLMAMVTLKMVQMLVTVMDLSLVATACQASMFLRTA